jgi:hypothetical protein
LIHIHFFLASTCPAKPGRSFPGGGKEKMSSKHSGAKTAEE